MSKDLFYGVAGLVLGSVVLVNWWFEMFSDCGYAKLCRSIATSFSPGRNTTALVEPAAGVAFVFGSAGGLLMTVGGMGVRPLPVALLMVAVVAFVVLLLGLIPFPLPAPMYPEWQMEKRQRLAARSGAGSAEEVWRRAGFSTGDPDVPEGFEEEFSPYQTPRRYSGRHKRRRKWLP